MVSITITRFGVAAALMVLALAGPAATQDEWDDEDSSPVEINGFVEGTAGGRVVDDPAQSKDILVNEARFRLDLAHYRDRAEFHFKGDFISDAVTNDTRLDTRRAAILLRVANWLDVVAGRQVLTWGTGDFVFVNDLFPKDFTSFFIGRDDEFLKAPSNSFKAAMSWKQANLDIVWTPTFEPDAYITGERLSFYSPAIPGLTSAAALGGPVSATPPDQTWENGEIAGRVYRNVRGYELAAYGYGGLWKQPTAVNPGTMKPIFTGLDVYGASARGNVLGGIGNVEAAYYDSYQDRSGTDPLIPNSQVRGVAGYERELVTDFSGGLQYYAEWIQDYDLLVAAAGWPAPEEVRHVMTLRLTRRLLQQTLTLSMFSFYSPNENDGHIRAAATRQWSDSVTITMGSNVMWGDAHTFFGQLQNNTNLYVRVRYSF